MDGAVQQPALPLTSNNTAAPPLLLVDGHHLLWSATFGFPAPVYSRDKTRTLTGTFAFFALLRKAIIVNLPGLAPEVIVVFDGQHGGAARKDDHDGYKASRPQDDSALEPLTYLPDVKRGLDLNAIPWTELEREEADDVIATIVHTNPGRDIVIMTGDQDYYQLISGNVRVLNTRFREGQRFVTASEVYRRHGVTPAQWADYRALMGDPADEIPGIRGIGAKTAATLLRGGLTLETLRDSDRLVAKRARAVAEEYDLALKWRSLIRLNTNLALPVQTTGQPSPTLPTPANVIEDLDLW